VTLRTRSSTVAATWFVPTSALRARLIDTNTTIHVQKKQAAQGNCITYTIFHNEVVSVPLFRFLEREHLACMLALQIHNAKNFALYSLF
jgi:hypothetical protein